MMPPIFNQGQKKPQLPGQGPQGPRPAGLPNMPGPGGAPGQGPRPPQARPPGQRPPAPQGIPTGTGPTKPQGTPVANQMQKQGAQNKVSQVLNLLELLAKSGQLT